VDCDGKARVVVGPGGGPENLFLVPGEQGAGADFADNAGPDAGVVSIDLDGEHFEFDLRHDTAEELGLAYQVPDSSIRQIYRVLWTLALVSFAVIFGFYYVLL